MRYLRRLGAKIGRGCAILNSIQNFGAEPYLIEIGDRVTLTAGVRLITHDGASRLFRDKLPNSSRYGNRFGTVVIRDESFIGYGAVLLPGITIGPNSIVGAGSVVNKSVPPNMVYAGVPARPICTLDEYVMRYQEKMIPLAASNRDELRRELTQKLWGEVR